MSTSAYHSHPVTISSYNISSPCSIDSQNPANSQPEQKKFVWRVPSFLIKPLSKRKNDARNHCRKLPYLRNVKAIVLVSGNLDVCSKQMWNELPAVTTDGISIGLLFLFVNAVRR
jgi:hypothetical protein